jgi:hypothetical protein
LIACFLDDSVAGARALRDSLRRGGFPGVGLRHIATLMKKMGARHVPKAQHI